MSAKSEALDMLLKARDKWAEGDNEHALEILDAASVRLWHGGHTPESLPTTFGLIEKIRSHLLKAVDQ